MSKGATNDWVSRFRQPPRLLGTLFWLHGTESEAELRRTFDLAVSSGIGELTLESRPHWDYLGPKWWSDLKLILGWCREAGVSVYLFDEKWYPSGVAGNTIQKLDPAYRRSSVRMQSVKYRGPLARVSVMPPWTERSRSEILSLYAYPVEGGTIDYESAVDLTGLLARRDSPHMHGIVHGVQWDVPPGEWLLVFIVEDRSDNYIDPLHPGAVHAFVERVYESSKTEVGAFFGHPIKGFFFDEPAYFNKEREVPWGYELRSRFTRAKGYDPLPYLPALWLKEESVQASFFVYDFYDFLNKSYAETYCRPIHEWCGRHGLAYIGHWYEHEAAPDHGERYMFHERTTEGPGDFFEVSRYADEGGIDLVCNQVIPGHRNRDYWGLPKLGSSAAHVYRLKDDLAMSETFGAYGWHLGLRMMKWLTDWQAVRGINHFILHAFNPKWPDLDCPPYFYDGGLNPQWPYFAAYVQYTNRLSYFFREGRHVASVLLLYPGTLGYAGSVTPIEDVQQVLQEHQYDYDLVPCDELVANAGWIGNRIGLQNETYDGIVIPGIEAVTEALLNKLDELAQAGIPVIFADRVPSRVVNRMTGDEEVRWLLEREAVRLSEDPSRLPGVLLASGVMPQIGYAGAGAAHLRVLHRIRDGRSLWLVSNEDVEAAVDGWMSMPDGIAGDTLVAWEPMTGERWALASRTAADEAGKREYRLRLPPYRSLILTAWTRGADDDVPNDRVPAAYTSGVAAAREVVVPADSIAFEGESLSGTGLPSWESLDPTFSGTIAYTWSLDLALAAEGEAAGGRIILDLGRVEEIAEAEVNGVAAGFSFVPPYRFDVTKLLRQGTNRFTVKVTNVVSNRMSRAPELEDAGADWKRRRETFAIPKDGGLLGPVTLEFHMESRGD